MAKGRLRFKARGTALVQDIDAMDANVRRFLGRKWAEVEPGRWGWVPSDAPSDVVAHAEYVRACQEGDLLPADAATAAACGVPWDPTAAEDEQ